MIEVDLREYAPVVTNPTVATEIFNKIMKEKPIENEIVINMEGLISLTLQSVNIIFGGLYDNMGADKFHENLLLKGCSDTLGDFMSFILNERKKKMEENGNDNGM